jgi:ArsR family transcriptional regulator, arsenate/arsenite/antimonite-responsive transcriptional repressor
MSNAITDEDIVTISKALADRTRLGMLRTIASRGCVCCGDVARAFDVTQATVSHHLKVLSNAGLVETRRDGQFIRVCAVRRTLENFRVALGHGFDQRP